MNDLIRSIIFNKDFGNSVRAALSSASSVYIFSAFVKTDALIWFANNIDENTKVRIIVRWQYNDLISGASDISAYKFAKENNWDFAINTNMHFKIYLIDDDKLYVGSANLTNSGLGLNRYGNDEASVLIVPNAIDIMRLKKYADSCRPMTDDLYEKLLRFYNDSDKKPPISKSDWPSNLKIKIQSTIDQLWIHDLLFNSPQSLSSCEKEHYIHDCAIFDLQKIDLKQRDDLLNRLKSTTVWFWLYRTIELSENKYVKFGELTAKLHNSLIDDPKPYRRTVKTFVFNIFEWLRYLNPDEISIRKFNHTEALFLRG
jgi:phosphatidylserine/phosphatidylglycerophosphate/cardiolipin synthase-like enzyme